MNVKAIVVSSVLTVGVLVGIALACNEEACSKKKQGDPAPCASGPNPCSVMPISTDNHCGPATYICVFVNSSVSGESCDKVNGETVPCTYANMPCKVESVPDGKGGMHLVCVAVPLPDPLPAPTTSATQYTTGVCD